eukprot:277519_1
MEVESNTQYEQFSYTEKKATNKYLVACLVVTCIALIVVSIIAGIYGSQLDQGASKNYCMTTECLETAADLSHTLNASVDPCNDFYHYVCDGWDDDNSWINLDIPQYGEFLAVYNREKDAFVDALFYNTKSELVDHTSVQQATAYFASCHDSENDGTETAVATAWMHYIVNRTTFISYNATASLDQLMNMSWDQETVEAFQSSLQFLTMLGYNPFFKLEAQSLQTPAFTQLIGLWQSLYDPNTLDKILHILFVPQYMDLFGLDVNSTMDIAELVSLFTRHLANITTVQDPAYQSWWEYRNMITKAPFSDLPKIFGSNSIIDYTELVYVLFNVPEDGTIDEFQYLTGGVSFFQNLGPFLEAMPPVLVQFYVQFAIAFYHFNFNEAYIQTRDISRTDFCFEKTKDAFPYVYGYILFNELYSDEAYETATALAEEIKLDGTKVLIEKAQWLDTPSKAEAVKKIDHMNIFIGFPPRLKNAEDLDKHYMLVSNMTEDWISNMITMALYSYQESNAVFWGLDYSLSDGWDDAFADPASFEAWLTGINAFYNPAGNWFTIPVTISQPPFLDASEGYPSSLTYGSLGWIVGHEMSHGFDPSGSTYNWNGTEVESIFSTSSLSSYLNKMDCFVDQYDNIEVDFVNGTHVYNNGSRTLGENVADNAGIRSSWTAWRKYIAKHGSDKVLHGVDMTEEQLFFVGAARVWCNSGVAGSNSGDDNVHSPNYARVIGTLQNMPEFALAFGCKVGSRMNPKNKCTVW